MAVGLMKADSLLQLGVRGDGANVTLMGRSEARLAEARAVLEAIDAPGVVSTVPGDVAIETDVEQAVDSARLEGSLDILVASAGRGSLSPVTATDADEWNDVMATNLSGSLAGARFSFEILGNSTHKIT